MKMRFSMKKVGLLIPAMAVLGVKTGDGPASAGMFTNIFSGKVVKSDAPVDAMAKDTGKKVGEGNHAFTSIADAGTNFIVGIADGNGGFLSPNIITAGLTVNDHNQGIGDSSEVHHFGGASGYSLQAFSRNSGQQPIMGGVQGNPAPANLPDTGSLAANPPQTLGDKDTLNGAPNLSTGPSLLSDGDDKIPVLDATVANPAAAVPEPLTLLLFGSGMIGLAAGRKRLKKT